MHLSRYEKKNSLLIDLSKFSKVVCHYAFFFGIMRSGARFLKAPKLFWHISGDIILFVSSKRRRLKARNFAVILIFIPFTTYEKTSLTE